VNSASDLETADVGFIERQLIKEALQIAERRENWNLSKEVLQPVVNAMRKVGATVSLSDHIDVRLTGNAATLAKAVRILRTSGFDFTSSSRPKKGDTTWSTFFTHDGCMRVWFSFSSSVCRMVQTGTKMIPQPIYETVCDDIQLPPDLAEVQALPAAPPATAAVEFELPF
jgi:hypothetical protein